MAENTEGSAAAAAAAAATAELSFKVKASKTHNVTISDSASVLELKTKLSSEEYENIPVERMRLIYSGRVLKDEEPLSKYNIKNGNTVHLVKSAASNPTPASASSSSTPTQPAVPANMSAGTSASNPLDNLTGARYAGFAGLPSADIFGPNGGMGAPPSAEDLANMISNPQTAQAMNEALNNPAMIDLVIQNNPMLRNLPNARELVQSQLPVVRQLMSDPEAMRNMLRMRGLLDGAGADGDSGGGFPAPGVTNTTPGNQSSASQQPSPNPFARLFGSGALANPFGAQPPPYARSASTSTTAPASGTSTAGTGGAAPAGEGAQPQAATDNAPAANPIANLIQAMGGGAGGDGGLPLPDLDHERMGQMIQQMRAEAARLRGAAPARTRGAAPAGEGAQPQAATDNAPAANYSANLLANLLQAMGGGSGAGGAGGAGASGASGLPPFTMDPQSMQVLRDMGFPAPADNQPPEERYAEQLRQLNDMGFTDFERNVTALRRSGGSVQGAIEDLLSG